MRNVLSKIGCINIILIAFFVFCGDSEAFSDSRFAHPTDKGDFGEEITVQQMEYRGYSPLPSKHTGNQGIDHVFVRRNNDGAVKDIIIAETKTDSSPYDPRQMSDKTIDEQIDKMRRSKDPDVRKAGELLAKNRDKIRKEYWRHDTRAGKTAVHELGADGQPVKTKAEYSTKRTQEIIYDRRNGNKEKGIAKNKSTKKSSRRISKRRIRPRPRKRIKLRIPF